MTLALLIAGGAALLIFAGKTGALGISTVPVPSDSSLIQKYGIFNPSHNILLLAQQSLQTMRIQYAAQTKSCAGGATPNSGTVNEILGVTDRFVSAIPVVGGLISDAIGFFGSVFDHHAQAAAREQATLCAATYAANKTLDQFDQAVASGQLSRDQYQPSLETIFGRLVEMSAGVAQGCPPTTSVGAAANKGNEACIVNRVFQAIAEKRLAQLGVVGVVS